MMENNVAIRAEHIFKTFRIPYENRDTIREQIFSLRKKLSYTNFVALDNVSFEIKKGEFLGLIGRNGSGKSTLLKILAGIYTQDQGIVTVNGEISPFLELGIGFNTELSGKDNIYLNGTILGLSKKEIERKYKEIVLFSEIEPFINLKMKNYSSGMHVRLAFSVAIHANKDILLMDEVLAVGDANFQVKCIREFENYKKQGKTVILVSHNLDAVTRFCDRAMLFRQGKLVCDGPSKDVVTQYILQNELDEQLRLTKLREET